MAQKVIVIGAGPAGMMAAVRAAQCGSNVKIYEKEAQPGQKLRLTGNLGGNVTNAATREDFLIRYGKNGRFLSDAFSHFFNKDLIEFFAKKGTRTIIEADGRVFQASRDAGRFVQCLLEYLKENHAVIFNQCAVREVLVKGKLVVGIRSKKGSDSCNRVILATGGLSYPETGSSGDGYEIAKELGHTVTALRPALVPLEIDQREIWELQGISLPNAALTLFKDSKRLAKACGGIVFTHYGLSGPAALALGKTVSGHTGTRELSIRMNFLPDLCASELDRRIISIFNECRNARVSRAIRAFVPERLAQFLVRFARIDLLQTCSAVSKEERRSLVNVLSGLILKGVGTRPIAEAMVTSGGISLKEIDPRTMGSKLIKGLFFGGEIIDIDGESGGYNLQAAFSTGYLAGESAALD